MSKTQMVIIAATLVISLRAVAQQIADRMSLPNPSGPYGIGRISYALVDDSRPEPLSKRAGPGRKVVAVVWYPTDHKATSGDRTAPYLPGFDSVLPKLSSGDLKGMFRPSTFKGIDYLPWIPVIEAPPIASGHQRFPLVLFSHGWGNPTFLYTAELADIVSHGYTVVAVEHPYDTAYTLFPDGDLILFAQQHFDAEAKKPKGMVNYARERVEVMAEDNRFVLTEVLRYATTRSMHAPFYKRIDESAIGAFGHSIGGLAAARTCQIDARVKACMDQDSNDDRGSPFIVTPLNQTEQQPFLLFVAASADLWSPGVVNPSDSDLAAQKMSREDYMTLLKKNQTTETDQLAGIQGGSYRIMLFGLPGFTHRSFSDQTLLDFNRDSTGKEVHNFQVAQIYTLAFFDKHLKGIGQTALDSLPTVDSRVRVERFPAH